MDYKELWKENNEEIEERFLLTRERLSQIALGEENHMEEALHDYFETTAAFLLKCCDTYQMISSGKFRKFSIGMLQDENRDFYRDILPQNYGRSYADPAWSVKVLGEEYGRILSFLYTELRSQRACVFEQNLQKITILNELFLEIYFLFANEKVTYKQIRETIYWFLYDYADEWAGYRVRELLDPSLDFAVSIVMDSNLSDLRYLYFYGDYISSSEIEMAKYLNSLPQEEIRQIAHNFTEGYRRGFELKGVDLSKKNTVNIRYPIGFERVIREAVIQFRQMGLEPVMYRAALNTLNKRPNIRIGYVATSPNPQYEYDHRFDNAIYLDKRMIDRKISCMRKAYEEYEEEAAGFAGPACLEVFGEKPFVPESKQEAYRLSERQQNLMTEYTALSNQLMNEFINQEERSFTIVAYPVPEIGNDFKEIFEEIRKVNTLDNEMYKNIQQRLIDVLDQAKYVKIMGRRNNMTNLTIALCDLSNPQKETKFENCLADVNIPVGEVFTSPKLMGTNGLLHVTEVYLNGLCYKNLKIWFENGMVSDYECGNFDDREEGRKFIEENLLFGRKTLPIGEFAIGTNTTAYVMAAKYGIMSKLPILIAEKMGPHLALGDTCYSYCEDVKVYNPDGKEIIAKENECSSLRREEPKKAYFNCHTDITIPYEELERIVAVSSEIVEVPEMDDVAEERVETPILLDGRFVLEGTMELNEPFKR